MKGGCLTTHVLDISSGRPAGGMKLELWRITANGTKERIRKIMTNTDGRPDAPLLEGEELTAGKYELVFAVGDYFVDLGTAAFDAGEPFLGEVRSASVFKIPISIITCRCWSRQADTARIAAVDE